MSRSFKKNPGFCDHNAFGKNQANKKVRRTKDVSDGCKYKKLYCSYNIHDWKNVYFSDEEIIKEQFGYKKMAELAGRKSYTTPLYKFYMK